MSAATASAPGAEGTTETLQVQGHRRPANWKPVLTLLFLSPAIGELLSGSSPPLQFFNPIFLLLLVGLYGCGALLVREIAVRRGLNAFGLLLLGTAYGIIEEGLTCKSFFNPYWTDTGYLSIYGRLWGVNWVWAFGLTFYHAVVSITVPIFLTEALFSDRARTPWLKRRGGVLAGTALGLVMVLGFLGFDNRQFHLIEMVDPLGLAQRLDAPSDPVATFVSNHLTGKNQKLVRKAVAAQKVSPELRHALQEELNRLLPRRDLYSPERFAGVQLPERIVQQTAHLPKGDKLVAFNRTLLEKAFPKMLAERPMYPYRPSLALTVCTMLVIAGLALAALEQKDGRAGPMRRPWLKGLLATAGFVVTGFLLPSLAEHGVRIPAILLCGIWCVLLVVVGRTLCRADESGDRLWRRGLWALGVISPWIIFALLLGLIVRFIGAKSFSGMWVVAAVFCTSIVVLSVKWRRRLQNGLEAMPPDTV